MTIQMNPQWPEHLWPLSDVTGWIATIFTQDVHITGPTDIYHEKPWGVTASFRVHDENVIFKGCKLPLFAKRLQSEALLAQAITNHWTLKLLGVEAFPNGETWTLHKAFRGQNVYETGKFEDILEMVRVLARVQMQVAEQLTVASALPTQTPITKIPEMLDYMIQLIEGSYLEAWLADDSRLLDAFNLPTNILEQLKYFRPQVQAWVDELVAEEWPLSIDQVDFHTNNAVVQDDGQILIFDWEEAVISYPFFSVYRLLDDADVFVDDPDSAPKTEGQLRLTMNQMAIRNAYIDVLPWKDRAKRERAFDVAMCLAPIKMAYECEPFNQAIGRENGSPDHAARCLGQALHYWQAMAGYHDLNIRAISKDELVPFSEMGAYSDEYLRETVSQMWETGQCRPEWCFVVEEDGEWVGRIVYHTLPLVFGSDPTVTFDFLILPWDDSAYLEFGVQLLRFTLAKLQAQGITGVGRHVWSGIDHPEKMHTLLKYLGMTAQRDKVAFQWYTTDPLLAINSRLQFRTLTDVGEGAFIDAIQKVTEGTLDRSLQQALLKAPPQVQAKGLFDECQKEFFSQPEWWQLAFGGDNELIGLLMPIMLSAEADEGWIGYIGVIPEHRGQGHIDELLVQATTMLQSANVTCVSADTDSENFPMIHAFKRVGYQSSGSGVDYFGHIKPELRLLGI